MDKRFFNQYVFILLLLVLTACTSQAEPTSSVNLVATTPHQSTAVNMPLLTETLLPTPSLVPLQPTPQDIIGGGTVTNGPFLFDFRIFRDAGFSQQPITPSLYSDMNGVGAYMYWVYQGTDPIGPVETYWGTLPHLDNLLQETYASIRFGSSGGRTGGILLPGGFFLSGNSKVGDHVQVALKVHTPLGDYGAVLNFTLIQGVSGFEPTDISVNVLQSGG